MLEMFPFVDITAHFCEEFYLVMEFELFMRMIGAKGYSMVILQYQNSPEIFFECGRLVRYDL